MIKFILFIIVFISLIILSYKLSTSYVTEDGMEFKDKWDYICNSGHTYDVSTRNTYPLFNKNGLALKCWEVK